MTCRVAWVPHLGPGDKVKIQKTERVAEIKEARQ